MALSPNTLAGRADVGDGEIESRGLADIARGIDGVNAELVRDALFDAHVDELQLGRGRKGEATSEHAVVIDSHLVRRSGPAQGPDSRAVDGACQIRRRGRWRGIDITRRWWICGRRRDINGNECRLASIRAIESDHGVLVRPISLKAPVDERGPVWACDNETVSTDLVAGHDQVIRRAGPGQRDIAALIWICLQIGRR